MGTWESSRTPKSSEFDYKGQNTLHCGVLYIIGNLLKFRCPKPIWTSTTQVMAKRKVGSQIGSLTPDHWKSRINPIPLCARGVWHVVGKLSTRATTLVHTPSRSEVCTKSYRPAKLRDSQMVQSILYGGRWWLPPSPGCGESCESRVARGLS
jgi:hypothetical protein